MWSIRTAIVTALVAAASAQGATLGSAFTYQGRLVLDGVPVNDTADLQFSLWDADTGGNEVASPQSVLGRTVVDGLVSVDLDFGASAFNGEARWVEIAVASPAGGSFTTLAPRQPLSATPYALYALACANVPDGYSLDAHDGSPVDALYVDNQGFVGIGTTSPYAPLMIINDPAGTDIQVDRGSVTSNLSASLQLMGARSDAAGPFAFIGFQNYDDDDSQQNYVGARIQSFNSEAEDSGDLEFFTRTASDTAVQRRVTISTTGNVDTTGWLGIGVVPTQAVLIQDPGATGSVGITQNQVGGSKTMEFTTQDSDDSQATRILLRGGSDEEEIEFYRGKRGSEAMSMILDSAGYLGIGTAAPDAPLNVSTDPNDAVDTAMHAEHNATLGTNYAILGQTHSTSGYGLRGEASATSGATYGVYGQTGSPSGWGVYAVGRIGATGTKSFTIDHPLDPTGKTLLHYCAEGPEPQNVYNGVAVFDADGEAWVSLPDYFDSINIDPRYQLTMIGGPARPYVAQEIQGNRFKIAGGAAGLKVSWEVRARRNDRFVQTYGAPVEVEKTGQERGRYLMPELYGQPAERGVHYRASRPVRAEGRADGVAE